MSTDKPSHSSASSTSSSGTKVPTDSDPTLDITSEKFDPLKALYASKVVLPVRNAKVYDNVGKYESVVIAKRIPDGKKQSKSADIGKNDDGAASNKKGEGSKAPTKAENPFQRKFLPHQMMVQGNASKSRHTRNLLTRHEENSFEGPLARLQQSMNEKSRVKIYTRNAVGINGYMTGIVLSFDKHWNIALSDVFEVWKRRKTHLCNTSDFVSVDDCTARLRQLRIKLPEIQVKSLNRKQVECSRHLPQILIRGEQVALIVMLKEEEKDVKSSSKIDTKSSL